MSVVRLGVRARYQNRKEDNMKVRRLRRVGRLCGVVPSVLLLAMTVLLLTAAGETEKKPGTGSATLITGTTGGTWYYIGAGMGEIMAQHAEYTRDFVVRPGIGSVGNVRLVGSGELEFGFTVADTAFFAYHGMKPFEKPYENLRHVLSGYENHFGFWVLDGSPIKDIQDMKGKRVWMQTEGSSPAFMLMSLLEAHGLEYGVDYRPVHGSYGDLPSAVGEGLADVFQTGTSLRTPHAWIAEVKANHKVRPLSWDSDVVKKFVADRPYYVPGVMRAGFFNAQDEDVCTLVSLSQVVTHKNVPEDVVYDFVKTILENKDLLTEIHAEGAEFTIDAALHGVAVPLVHPGAIRYYKEKGVWEGREGQ